jgi:hypothetical protein
LIRLASLAVWIQVLAFDLAARFEDEHFGADRRERHDEADGGDESANHARTEVSL